MNETLSLFENNPQISSPPILPLWQGSAEFENSPIGKLRWRLDRWRGEGPRALIVMCNPSFAGSDKDDPTIRTIKRLLPDTVAGFTVVNWEPYIATNPDDLYDWRETWGGNGTYEKIREVNYGLIRRLSESASIRYVAWGNLVPLVPHTQRVIMAISCDLKYPLCAFGLTKDGTPKHPMARGKSRISDGAETVVWRSEKT